MWNLFLNLLLTILVSFFFLADAKLNRISSKAVWQPGMEFMHKMRSVCGQMAFPDYGKCFVAEAKKAGAPIEATTFIQLTGNQGFMRDFRDTGKVDVAYATFPFRANENQVLFLVNGEPSMIDVDDIKWFPKESVENDPTYQRFKKKYPELNVFPGDRFGTRYPLVSSLPAHGQRFIVPYTLRNQCHACEVVLQVKLGFDFDSQGKFQGAHLVEVEAYD